MHSVIRAVHTTCRVQLKPVHHGTTVSIPQ